MKVKISTPSRLHFGLIDFNASLGRIDGGAGVALSSPGNVLYAKSASEFKANFSNPKYIEDIAKGICARLGRPLPPVEITVEEHIPGHAGFGSKTQMSLALATIICKSYGVRMTRIEDLACLTGRGGTSGIGVRAFDQGGFIVDCGHSFGEGKEKTSCLPSSASNAHVAPLVLRHEVPPEWRFILVTPLNYEGSHGQSEIDIFRSNFPQTAEVTGKVCRVILMQMIPGILENDIDTFGAAINNMQSSGFKNVEVQLKSPLVPNMLNIMNSAGAAGSGMSSFGPTVYAVTDSDNKAERIRKAITGYLNDLDTPHMSWIAEPNNHGATYTDLTAEKKAAYAAPIKSALI